jgi:receptor tyrosine kinase-like orphan receptor 1
MIYSLMIECWHEVANRRPQFPEIHHRLHNWYVNQTYLSDFCESITSYSGSSHKSTNKTNSTQLSAPIYKSDSLTRNQQAQITMNKHAPGEAQPMYGLGPGPNPSADQSSGGIAKILSSNFHANLQQQTFANGNGLGNACGNACGPYVLSGEQSGPPVALKLGYKPANGPLVTDYEDKQCCSPKLSGAKKVLPAVVMPHQPGLKCAGPANGTRPIQNGAQLVVRLPDPSKVLTETRLSKQ